MLVYVLPDVKDEMKEFIKVHVSVLQTIQIMVIRVNDSPYHTDKTGHLSFYPPPILSHSM